MSLRARSANLLDFGMTLQTQGSLTPFPSVVAFGDVCTKPELVQDADDVNWSPIPPSAVSDAFPGTAFTTIDAESRQLVEIRLLPWLRSEESLANLKRQLRLVNALAPCSRRVIRSELTVSPARLVLEQFGMRLSSVIDHLPIERRVAYAQSLWAAAAPAIAQGLYHGRLSSEQIWFQESQDSIIAKVDYFSRFYLDTTFSIEPMYEADCHALIGITHKILLPLIEDELVLSTLPGRERGQLKKLIRQGENEGRALESFDQWTQLFDSLESLRPSLQSEQFDTPPCPIGLTANDDEQDRTAEVSIDRPEVNANLESDQTGEVEIAPLVKPKINWTMPSCGDKVGRFRLDSILGQGGMGVVFRGVDLSNDEPVAVKILRPTGGDIAQAVRRFKKEARLLAGVQNEYVTQLLDAGHDNGMHYLAMEFVPGTNLKTWLQRKSTIDESQALRLTASVARALVDAHQQEIVHRDIKPENVLLGFKGTELPRSLDAFRVKLSDFGIARSMVQSESMEVTRAGTLLGTPTYMSPEQCKGTGDVTPASDVYSLGITLYAMLAGQPPFSSNDPMKLAAMHCFDPPVALNKRNRQVTEQTVDLVNRMLAKDPAHRPSDAAQVVREIERILRGDACDFEVHPKLPINSSRSIWERNFEWRFESSSEQLWPYVSNTERLNRAAGLQSVEYHTEKSTGGGVRRIGTFRLAGIQIAWEEHPFEWIEGRRMGVLREFASGPFRWFLSVVELIPQADGGTLLKHTVRIDPRNVLGRLIATIEAGWKGGRSLDRIYRRINESIQHQQRNTFFDPFEVSRPASHAIDQRAQQRVEKMIECGVPAETAEQLKSFILAAAPQALAQLKPFELADRLNLTIEDCLDTCLVAAHCGLLKLRWDILCPTCRAPASTSERLSQIGQHTECEACDTEFASNVASAIELVFQAHPEIREIDDGQYCIGGPEHSPHVVTQLRLAPEERIELTVPLTVGDYILRIPRQMQVQPLRARAQSAPSSVDLKLSRLGEGSRTPVVRSGAVSLSITNDSCNTQVIRLERAIDRKNVITAATASALPRFRELFPEQIFDRKNAIASDNLTLLTMRVSSVDELYAECGDAEAYRLLQTTLEVVESCVVAHQGSVIKSVGEALLCSFRDSAHAACAALEAAVRIAEIPELANIRTVAAIHRGPLLVTTQNGRLDYFGSTARQVAAICDQAIDGVLLSDTVFTDPGTQQVLQNAGVRSDIRTFSITLTGSKQHLVQHVGRALKS